MKKRNILLLLIAILVYSCGENKLKVDVSNIKVDVKVRRFDQDLYVLSKKDLLKEIPILEQKYKSFFELYTSNVLRIGYTNERDFFQKLEDFLLHPDWSAVYREVQNKYKDVSDVEDGLREAFKHYKYYYPEVKVPEIYTCISGFNYAVFTDENIMGIGLDFYLERNNVYYKMAQFPEYQRYNMTRSQIVTDCMQAFAVSNFVFNDSVNTLLSQMVYNGKIQYFMHALMPEQSDSVLFGYTPVQLKWVASYEDKVWAFMVEKKHLFSDDNLVIKKYIEPSPFTSYFTNNSAPRLGVYIGWKIVMAYMENNPTVTLQQMMANDDYNSILNLSGYNP
jgi:gliding motility-associated lipoprotein GldB